MVQKKREKQPGHLLCHSVDRDHWSNLSVPEGFILAMNLWRVSFTNEREKMKRMKGGERDKGAEREEWGGVGKGSLGHFHKPVPVHMRYRGCPLPILSL